ncbi:MAG: hypothetical protein MUO67_00960 [Anaerolineales bacterium]|nr:hypothetical protein [Anaerolineales bacterium]
MKKRTLSIILLIFMVSSVLTAAAPAKTNLARLEISNKTGEQVHVQLRKGSNFYYYLSVDAYATKTLTVEREVYRVRIFACGGRRGGEIDDSTNVRLVIEPCENPGISSQTIINKTGEKVELSLRRTDNFYHLSVDPNTTKTFSVASELFAQDTFSCGKSISGYLDMESSVRLVFTGCGEPAPNKGEPPQEKVHIDDSPGETVSWRYFNWD